MKIEFLLLPEYGEQSKRKNEQIPLSSRCGLATMQRGDSHRLDQRYCCLFLGCSGLYPTRHATQRARSEIFKLSLFNTCNLSVHYPSMPVNRLVCIRFYWYYVTIHVYGYVLIVFVRVCVYLHLLIQIKAY